MFDDLATLHGVQKVETAGMYSAHCHQLCYRDFHAIRFAFFTAPLLTVCLKSVGDCYIVAGGILGLDPEGFAEVGCCFCCFVWSGTDVTQLLTHPLRYLCPIGPAVADHTLRILTISTASLPPGRQ